MLHPAIRAYVGRGRFPGQDADAAEDFVNTAELGIDNALMRISSD